MTLPVDTLDKQFFTTCEIILDEGIEYSSTSLVPGQPRGTGFSRVVILLPFVVTRRVSG
jgi:hypothetical protein